MCRPILVLTLFLLGLLTPPIEQPRFAFWYETWTSDTWQSLRPANVFIGVPPTAVSEIHLHGGKALNYVTFYQSRFGSAFLRDYDDLNAVGFHTDGTFLPSAFGGQNNYVLCSNSTEVRSRALRYVNQALSHDHFDGFFVDNTYLAPAAARVCDGVHSHVKAGQTGGAAYIDLLKTIRDSVKNISPDGLLVTNSGNPTSFTYQSQNLTLWDLSDYVVWESYGYASLPGKEHDRWKNSIAESYELARSPRSKKIIALSYPTTYSEALFSYSVASVFGFQYAANLGTSAQGKQIAGGHYGAFLSELPMLNGDPSGPPPAPLDTILSRSYKNGQVLVNLGQAQYSFHAVQAGVVYDRIGHNVLKQGSIVQILPSSAVIVTF